MKQFKYQIPALNTEKIINKIIKKYQIFGLKKYQEKCIFYCNIKDKKHIQKILNNSGITALNTEYNGVFKHFKNITKIGIIAGIIISVILWVLSTFFITDILIIGNINFTQKQIMQVLKNQNIKKWNLKSDINIKKLESEILNINYISYVSAILKGNALVINVKEQLTNSEVVQVGKYEPLVASCDGRITAIKVIQGTANVKVGDIVKVGDVLVKPYIQKSNQTLSVQPLADIVCDVWYSARLEVKDVMYKKTKTGKYLTNYSISLFGLDIYKSEQQINFLDYQKDEQEGYLSNTLLPLKIKYTTYYEYINQKIETNFEQNKQIYIEQTRQMSLLNVKDYDIIKEESYSISPMQGGNVITYTITVNKKIF